MMFNRSPPRRYSQPTTPGHTIIYNRSGVLPPDADPKSSRPPPASPAAEADIGGDMARSAKPPMLPTFPVIHPATGEVVHFAQRSTPADLNTAVETAFRARHRWASTPIAERKAIIANVATLLTDPEAGWASRLIEVNRRETYCTFAWAQWQMDITPDFIHTLVAVAEESLKETEYETDSAKITVTREPFGLCLSMSPWNAVHVLTMRAIATPLLAGNTVIFKTHDASPASQTLWAELFYAAGVPRDVLVAVHVAPEDAAGHVSRLIADHRIRHINFTGSTHVGRVVSSQAGQYLKPTLLELSGKAPVILLPDADLQIAASHILYDAFNNAGQICMSTERVLVPRSRYLELVSCLREAWEEVPSRGDRIALYSSAAGERVKRLLDDAFLRGAASVLDVYPMHATRAGESLAYIEPAFIGPMKQNMRLWDEESFGPIAGLVRVEDQGLTEEQVVDRLIDTANESEFGLSASVWGRNEERARQVARRIEAGAVHVNSSTVLDHPIIPHGGWKSSGWGRFNGSEGMRSFTQTRSIEVPKQPPVELDLSSCEL